MNTITTFTAALAALKEIVKDNKELFYVNGKRIVYVNPRHLVAVGSNFKLCIRYEFDSKKPKYGFHFLSTFSIQSTPIELKSEDKYLKRAICNYDISTIEFDEPIHNLTLQSWQHLQNCINVARSEWEEGARNCNFIQVNVNTNKRVFEIYGINNKTVYGYMPNDLFDFDLLVRADPPQINILCSSNPFYKENFVVRIDRQKRIVEFCSENVKLTINYLLHFVQKISS